MFSLSQRPVNAPRSWIPLGYKTVAMELGASRPGRWERGDDERRGFV